MNNKKFQSLQGLRALSTIGIFLFHSGFLLKGTFPVTLFFMLSGFMMYYTKYNLNKYKNYSEWIKKYCIKKVKQFYPLHIFTFIISLFVGKVLINKITIDTILSGLANLFLVQTFIEKYALTYNGLSWYLSVTFFLYFIGYFLIKYVNKTKINTKLLIFCVLIFIFVLNIYNRINGPIYLYTNPLYRILDFLLGILIAKLYMLDNFSCRNPTLWETLIIILFIIQYVISVLFMNEVGCGYYSLVFAVALLLFAYGKGAISKLLSIDLFDKIANYSFEFYMIHELVLRIFRNVFSNFNFYYPIQCLIIAVPSLIISIVLAVLLKKFLLHFNK